MLADPTFFMCLLCCWQYAQQCGFVQAGGRVQAVGGEGGAAGAPQRGACGPGHPHRPQDVRQQGRSCTLPEVIGI